MTSNSHRPWGISPVGGCFLFHQWKWLNLIHQIKVTALIEGMVAEVVIEYHAYPQVSNEQISKEKSEALRKANELREEIEALANDCSIKLKHGFFAETDECFNGYLR